MFDGRNVEPADSDRCAAHAELRRKGHGLAASVAPLTKVTCAGSAPTSAATCRRALSTAARAALPLTMHRRGIARQLQRLQHGGASGAGSEAPSRSSPDMWRVSAIA